MARGRPRRLVWQNEAGGLTFEVSDGDGRFFVKWLPPERADDLDAEAARLRWAAPFVVVPHVIDQHRDPSGGWLATTAVPGDNAVSSRWRSDPGTAVRAMGEGLRSLHERLPRASCPFSWSAAGRLADAERRAATGRLDPRRWDPVHRSLDLATALARAADIPPVDSLVVCHGDSCAPNTILTDDGRCAGHVDLGAMGLADRWADLAVATWSTEWNYGPGWEQALLDAYGLPADPERSRYYRLLWDLGP
ncbi:MAG: weak similarity to aminoglycoside phosphotransferase [uncultured Acidimicrobiales bacterium]|uniref:Weak similarity to aminoglycoside phosphotransferase n=1 Tax=uncultured Acidimicrobiales bacterium TaxID=310071 RepID=A0A6J4HS18_9ACTN|nr:MAG: weak similarity to aminoglycoside phosphotransferase [uncultured Acidimicrobiales bacterium]